MAGTNDVSAYLAVPDAIHFQEAHNWTAVRAQCHTLLTQTMHQIGELTNLPSLYPSDSNAGFYHQMATIPLPQLANTEAFKTALLEEFKVEVPIVTWNGRHFIRVSIQVYNTPQDVEVLLDALTKLLPVHRSE